MINFFQKQPIKKELSLIKSPKQSITSSLSQEQVLIHALFPKVFMVTQLQDDKVAQILQKSFFKRINQIKNNNRIPSLYEKTQLQILSQRSAFFKQYSTKYFCQYGSLIVLRKQQSFYPSQIYVVFPKQWDHHSQINSGRVKSYASDPNSSSFKEIGILTNQRSLSLEEQSQRFYKIVEKKLALEQQEILKDKEKQKRKNFHTASWLIQVCKFCLKLFNQAHPHISLYDKIQSQSDKVDSKSQLNQKQIIQSRGGTLVIGNETQSTKPNTSCQMVKSYMNFLFQNNLLSELIITDFKLNILSKYCKKTQGTENCIKMRQRCLQSLAQSIKKLTNELIGFNRSYAQQQLQNIRKSIYISVPQLQIKKIQKKNIFQQIVQKEISALFCFKSLSNLIDSCSLKKEKGHLGNSQSFQQINKISILNKSLNKNYIWAMKVQDFFFRSVAYQLNNGNLTSIKVNQICCKPNQFSDLHLLINTYQEIVLKDPSLYGHKLKNQTYSHIYLLKAIAATAAFEIIKSKKPLLKNNFIPDYLSELINNFYSLNYEARQALISLEKYYKNLMLNPEQKQFLTLQKSNRSWKQLAVQQAKQNTTIINWIKNSTTNLNRNTLNLQIIFDNFKIQYQKTLEQYQVYRKLPCYCIHQTRMEQKTVSYQQLVYNQNKRKIQYGKYVYGDYQYVTKYKKQWQDKFIFIECGVCKYSLDLQWS